MKNICVVTGGGSGMGLAAAKIMGKDHSVILVGRTVKKLEGALQELLDLEIEAEVFPCDVSSRASVQELASHAAKSGNVKAVINAAGMSPHMASGELIFDANAMGTIYVNEEFSKVMKAGSCIVNVSSMSAYMMAEEKLPRSEYKVSLSDPEQFRAKMLAILGTVPQEAAPNMAYMISKNFVIWYAAQCACLYGSKGIRVLSVSPGTFNTPMGEIEGEEAASFARRGALGRVGEVDEMARLIAFIAGDGAGYLTGTDILCDGGTIAAMRRSMEK